MLVIDFLAGVDTAASDSVAAVMVSEHDEFAASLHIRHFL